MRPDVTNTSTRPPQVDLSKVPLSAQGPSVIFQKGDTSWIQVHIDDTHCPGDPLGGHGGEATGGPGPSETWCFEGNWPYGDSCGTNPPWDTECFGHHDRWGVPSMEDFNYWHVSDYRTNQRYYLGDSALWCGWDSTALCGAWETPPGYGFLWNCIAMLELPGTFDVANGCTLFFDPRYDTECKYDYFYVELYNGTEWVTLALLNATSNNPGPECGAPTGGNPDYWGNTDIDRLTNCDWQTRAVTGEPAFKAEIDPGSYSYTAGPRFRWRFDSDDGSDDSGFWWHVDTDGAAFIDNVWVYGDDERYIMDFESGLDAYWSFPDPEGIIDQWHMVHDADPPYEGGDGGDRTGCEVDSSIAYRARPEMGYQVGAAWRNKWIYTLHTPEIPLTNTGCVVQYDTYVCVKPTTLDYVNTWVRFGDPTYPTLCEWWDVDGYRVRGGCRHWFLDRNEDVTSYIKPGYETMQFHWTIYDGCWEDPNHFLCGKHGGTDFIVDNVSVGFFDGSATIFMTGNNTLLHDTFFTNLCAYCGHFEDHDPDTVNHYANEANPLPWWTQLRIQITDHDEISTVQIFGSLDEGSSWVSVPMALHWPVQPENPAFGGDYAGTLCPSTFSLSEWPVGTEVWYYVRVIDDLGNEEFFPNRADPGNPDHTGTAKDYLEFSILPTYPPEYEGPRILLVGGDPTYDYSPCLHQLTDDPVPTDLYGQILADAGYCYDKYDLTAWDNSPQRQYICTWHTDYDAVIWYTGQRQFWLFWDYVQSEMRNYLAGGGKVMICGDRVAYWVAPEAEGGAGNDSLAGDFLDGILGTDYLSEMPGVFVKPYVYAYGVPSVDVFGTPTPLDLDTLAIYRECPYTREMSWIKAITAPPAGYTAQPLLDVLNPDVPEADMGIYTEYQGVGQCVFINFDLSSTINHTYDYCDGNAPPGYQSYTPGYYEGRVDLMLTILQDIFGLPSSGPGAGGTVSAPAKPVFQWALHQNTPNPVGSRTEVHYEVARASDVSLKVYNARGQLVRALVSERKEPGRYTVHWDGTNSEADRVSSGVYFCRMEAGSFSSVKKMLVVR